MEYDILKPYLLSVLRVGRVGGGGNNKVVNPADPTQID